MKNLNEVDLMSEFFSRHNDDANQACLDSFSLAELLQKNIILLGSDTQKYDSKDQDTNSSCSSTSSGSANPTGQMNEKLKQQRHLLNLKLGIDVGGAAKLDTSHIFSDYDIISSATQDAEAANEPADMNRAKRRIQEAPGEVKSEPGIDDMAKKRIKTEASIDSPPADSDDTGNNVHILRLNSFTRWLFARLFDAEWEHRHGAASCLREIIKKLVQLISKMSTPDDNRSPMSDDHKKWFESCLCKLFQVIALDRFADYIGDETVAPVRETCTQTIGVISQLYTKNSLDIMRLCSVINMFLASDVSQWEISHSGNFQPIRIQIDVEMTRISVF